MLAEDSDKFVGLKGYKAGLVLTPRVIRSILSEKAFNPNPEVKSIVDQHWFFSQDVPKPNPRTHEIQVGNARRNLTIAWEQSHPDQIGGVTVIPDAGPISITIQSGPYQLVSAMQSSGSQNDVLAAFYHELLHVVVGVRRMSGSPSGDTWQSCAAKIRAAKEVQQLRNLSDILFDKPAWRIALTIPHSPNTVNVVGGPVREAWIKIGNSGLEFAAEEVWALKMSRRRFTRPQPANWVANYAQATLDRMQAVGKAIGASAGPTKLVDDFEAYRKAFNEFLLALYPT